MKKLFCLNNFTLKLLACLFMLIDHLGLFLTIYLSSSSLGYQVGEIFRYIGRLALPIFAFLVVEGALHTKNMLRYILRMSIMALIIGISLIVIQYGGGFIAVAGLENIFLLFTLSLLTIYFLNMNKYKKLLALIPSSYVIFTYIIKVLNNANVINLIKNYPCCLLPEYSLYGFALIVGGYYLIRLFNSKVHSICQSENIDELSYIASVDYRKYYNLISLLPITIITCISTLFDYVAPYINIYENSIMSYSVIAIVFIVLYNGKLGPSNKYIKYGFYLFYPVHIILIFAIFALIFM